MKLIIAENLLHDLNDEGILSVEVKRVIKRTPDKTPKSIKVLRAGARELMDKNQQLQQENAELREEIEKRETENLFKLLLQKECEVESLKEENAKLKREIAIKDKILSKAVVEIKV